MAIAASPHVVAITLQARRSSSRNAEKGNSLGSDSALIDSDIAGLVFHGSCLFLCKVQQVAPPTPPHRDTHT